MDAEAYVDLLPWLLFVVIDRNDGLDVRWAAGTSAAAGVALAAWAYWQGRRAPVARLGVAVFGACSLAAIVDPTWNLQVAWPRALAALVLSLAAAASLWLAPLSEAYASPRVAPALRGSPEFRRVNVEVTRAWALGALVVAATYLTTEFVHMPVAVTVCNWVVPLAVTRGTILWVARRFERFTLGGGPSGKGARPDGAIVPFVQFDGSEDAPDAVIHQFPFSDRKSG